MNAIQPKLKHTIEEYENADVFPSEDVIHMHVRKVRAAHGRYVCYGLKGEQNHYIRSTQLHWVETGMVDGKWGRCRICLPCMDKFLDGDY